MKFRIQFVVGAAMITSPLGLAAVKVEVGQSQHDQGFKFDLIPPPATNDAATAATFTLVDGQRDGNGGDLAVLNDGRMPSEADEPSRNFFFQNGTNGGRIQLDLGKDISIKAVNTYSWHPRTRGPQVYKLYGATGEGEKFIATPQRNIDLRGCGWKPIAAVDSRKKGAGGQHAVSISDAVASSFGKFRYLLLDFKSADIEQPQANTFLSEKIDVIDANGPASIAVAGKVTKTYPSPDGKTRYVVDSTLAPDLVDWVEKELLPMVYIWYPKMVAMLPSDHFTAPDQVIMEFRDDTGGTPAYASGNKLSMSIPWFRTQLQGEAKGCVIHELVHIVQKYGQTKATDPRPSPTPGWVVEGIPDYIRWFIYEPQAKGAEITKNNFAESKYDASYRTSANFLNWIVLTHDKEFIRKLNAAAREGRYSDKIWLDATGKTAAELGEDWKKANAKRLGI